MPLPNAGMNGLTGKDPPAKIHNVKTLRLYVLLAASGFLAAGCETVSTSKTYSLSSSDPVPSTHSFGSVSQPKKAKTGFLGLW